MAKFCFNLAFSNISTVVKSYIPDVERNLPIRPCTPYRMSADMVAALGCGTYPGTHNTSVAAQIVPFTLFWHYNGRNTGKLIYFV